MKTGIVFEGGALRTVFSCGVMDALLENKIHTDYILGVSAGASYAVSYATRQTGRNLKIIQDYTMDKKYMGISNLINPRNKCYFGLDYVYDVIPNQLVPIDYDALKAYPGEIKAVVTNMNTGQPEYLDLDRDDKRFMLLRATCALPIMFPIININSKPYMDGGISDSIPYKKAFEDGCDRVIVVLTRENGYIKTEEKSTKAALKMYRKYPQFCDSLKNRPQNYNNSINELKQLEKEGRVYVLRPQKTEGFSRVEKDLNKINSLYKDGYNQVYQKINEIRNYMN